jgi:hypothetical protein
VTRFAARLVATGLLLLGCDSAGGCQSIGLWAPPATDPKGAQVERARLKWNDVTRTGWQIEPETGWRGWEVAFVDQVHCEASNGTCSGYTDEHKQVLQVWTGLSVEETYPVVLHELGHVLGLKHTCVNPYLPRHMAAPDAPTCPPGSIGVMDGAHVTPLLTDFDIAECRRVNACW